MAHSINDANDIKAALDKQSTKRLRTFITQSEEECEDLSKAMTVGDIMIATLLAGRGVDLKLDSQVPHGKNSAKIVQNRALQCFI